MRLHPYRDDRLRDARRCRGAAAIGLVAVLVVACNGGAGVPGPPRVDWSYLGDLDVATGATSPSLDALLGPFVKIPGYIVPFEDSLTSGSTFLLVPSAGSCIHLPPPAPNQMILVEMDEGVEVEFDIWSQDPIWVLGTIRVNESDSPWGSVGFAMQAQDVIDFYEGLPEDGSW